MDAHSLDCLDFLRVRDLLSRYALTPLGKARALGIQPGRKPAAVRRWRAQVLDLQAYMQTHGSPPMADVRDVVATVEKCAPPLRVDVDDIAAIGRTLRAAAEVAAYLADLPDEAEHLLHLRGRIGDFSSICGRIFAIIDPRGQVRDDASPRITRIRRDIARARVRIRETVERLLQNPSVRRLLQFANHTYVEDRLVLPLRTECRGRLPGIVHRGSGSGATLFVEPSQAVELNNQISNLKSEEDEEITRLLWDLAHEVHINATPILKTLDALGVLDLTVAKVRYAEAFDARCPEILDEPTLQVRGARHPLLLEMTREAPGAPLRPEEVVPIDYRLGVDFDLLVITGPNTGGKTVTLKTIGLLSLMVQAGIPVPVGPGARFGVFGNVLIDIGDEQSMAQSLSTFSAHIRRQLDMLSHAGPDTLVLIDELGAGTDPDEGAAIGVALLEELLRRRTRGVLTTHIGALKGFPLQNERAENACVDFDSRTLRPTYELRIGEPGTSNAIQIAARMGMPKHLVTASKKHLGTKANALNRALSKTRDTRRQAETALAGADDARLSAEKAEKKAREAREKLRQQQDDFQRWLQRIAHLRAGDTVRVRNFDGEGKVTRVRLEHQRAEVEVGSLSIEVPFGDILPPEVPPPPPAPERPGRVRKRQPESERPQTQRRRRAGAPNAKRGPGQRPRTGGPALVPLGDADIKALKPNDSVYVKRFHREGTVVRVEADKRVVIVSAGVLEVEVPFNGLARKSDAN